MRNRLPVIAALALLLLFGFGAAAYWIAGDDAGMSAAPVIDVAFEDPELQPAADPGPAFADSLDFPDAPVQPESMASPDDANETVTDEPSGEAETTNPFAAGTKQTLSREELLRLQAALKTEKGEELAALVERSRALQDVFQQQAGVEFKVTLSGRVMDEYGRGIEGAKVRATRSDPTDGQAATQLRNAVLLPRGPVGATTDASGFYSAVFTLRVPEGTTATDAVVSATADGFSGDHPAAVSNLRENDERSGVNITLKRAAVLTGRVVDDRMSPIAGAYVWLEAAQSDRANTGARQIWRSPVRTDKDGVYRLENIQAGEWTVRVTEPRHFPAKSSHPVLATSGQEVVVPDIPMQRSATLRVKVLKEDGSPIGEGERNSRVRVRVTFQVAGKTTTKTATSAADGSVVVNQVPSDAIDFSLNVAGYQPSGPLPLRAMAGEEYDAGTVRMVALQR